MTRQWIKSSLSCGAGECVEVALEGGEVWVRDSKLGEESPVLVFTRAEFEAFLAGVKAGEFELGTLWARSAGDGSGGDARARSQKAATAGVEASRVSR